MTTRATVFETIDVAPGAVHTHTLFHSPARIVAAINMDPPSAGAFAIERIDRLSAGEVLALTGENRPAVMVRVRNTSSRPARFRAEVVTHPDTEAIEAQLAGVVEETWKRGGDR